MKVFSERLRVARAKKGIRQGVLAEQLGMTQSSISAYERATNEPSLATLVVLADALDVSTDWLLGRDEDRNERYGGTEEKRIMMQRFFLDAFRECINKMEDELEEGDDK